jgi:hypothetical protein
MALWNSLIMAVWVLSTVSGEDTYTLSSKEVKKFVTFILKIVSSVTHINTDKNNNVWIIYIHLHSGSSVTKMKLILKHVCYIRRCRSKVSDGILPSKPKAGTSRGKLLRFQIECQKGLFREAVPVSSTVPSSLLVFLPPESDENKDN